MNQILLPGLNKQIKFMLNRINIEEFNSLVVGSQSVEIAKIISDKSRKDVDIIVEDYETLMITNIEIGGKKNISAKLMDFETTDFNTDRFDLIYSQASITNFNRKKIVKELKRILKQDGFLCIGEIVKLNKNTPVFIQDVFNSSNLNPLHIDELEKYYTDRDFRLVDSVDLSNTLTNFYQDYYQLLKNKSKSLKESEKSFYKKILNKISHESNIYLKLGGSKQIGYKALLLKKN